MGFGPQLVTLPISALNFVDKPADTISESCPVHPDFDADNFLFR